MKEKSGPNPPDPAGPQGTMIFRPDDLRDLFPGETGRPDSDPDRPRLVGLRGVFESRGFPLRPGRNLIGRRASNDIVLDVASVSALHAWIVHERGEFRIINALSTNGTFVNGGKVHETPLVDGDLIRFGDVELRFQAGKPSGRQPFLHRFPHLWAWTVTAATLIALTVWALLYR